MSTTTTAIPADNTIPQITEGGEFMTQAITPKATNNKLVISGVLFGSTSTTANLILALFQDSTANALGAWEMYNTTATAVLTVPFSYTMTAGTTSSTTFRIRAASAAGATFTFNGSGGTQRFSTATKSYIQVTEYKV